MSHLARLVVVALLVVQSVPTLVFGSVQVELERAVKGTPLRGATLGVSIRDSDTRTTIGEINPDEAMIPASNMKLLTTGAALHVFGGDFSFHTRLLREGDRLIVKGEGDPGFGDPQLLAMMNANDGRGLGVEEFLDLWIQPILDSGIEQVNELIIDARVFDREFVHHTWPVEQLNRRYCAEVAGLNFHLNVLHFYPSPGANGGRPDVSRFEPYIPSLEIANSSTSRTGRDDPNSVWIARQHGTNNLRFYGNVKHTYRAPVPVTIHDMPTLFGRLLAHRLNQAGVSVASVRLAELSDPKFEGELAAPIISTPLSTILVRCNRDSQNLYAEAILKRIGAALTRQPGSWVNGATMVRHAIHERLGRPGLASSIVIADGSGLSRDNRVSPAAMTAWLNTFHNDDAVEYTFIESLATPGGPGTLRNRFRTTNLHGMFVHAKSGYINGVSCLSGYVTAPDGRRRSFSIMMNDIPDPLTLRRSRELQEEIVGIIARDLASMEVRMGSD